MAGELKDNENLEIVRRKFYRIPIAGADEK